MDRDFEICENNFYNTVRTEKDKTAGYIKEFQNSWGQNNMQVHWIYIQVRDEDRQAGADEVRHEKVLREWKVG